jgi:hypothetical protein
LPIAAKQDWMAPASVLHRSAIQEKMTPMAGERLHAAGMGQLASVLRQRRSLLLLRRQAPDTHGTHAPSAERIRERA